MIRVFFSPSLSLCCRVGRGLSLLPSINHISLQKCYPVGPHQLYMCLSYRWWSPDYFFFFFICRRSYFLSSPASGRCSLTHSICLIVWKDLFFPAVFPLTSAKFTADWDQNLPCIWECLDLAASRATVFQTNIYICVLFVVDSMGNN